MCGGAGAPPGPGMRGAVRTLAAHDPVSVYGAMRFRTAPTIGEPGWADGKGTDATHSRARETRRQNAPWAQPSLGCVSKIETGGNMNEWNKIS